MDCSLLGFPVHGILQNTGVGSHSLLQGIFLTQGLNLGLLHCREILYCLSHQQSPQSLNHPDKPSRMVSTQTQAYFPRDGPPCSQRAHNVQNVRRLERKVLLFIRTAYTAVSSNHSPNASRILMRTVRWMLSMIISQEKVRLGAVILPESHGKRLAEQDLNSCLSNLHTYILLFTSIQEIHIPTKKKPQVTSPLSNFKNNS